MTADISKTVLDVLSPPGGCKILHFCHCVSKNLLWI